MFVVGPHIQLLYLDGSITAIKFAMSSEGDG